MNSLTSFGTPTSLSVASSIDHGLNGRCRRGRSNSVVDAIPLEPLKRVQHMDSLERCFLEAAERGDKNTVLRCLRHQPHPVNVNCTTMLGQTAIQIAVDNENVEIVELLLQQPDIRIGDALLQAIHEGVYRIVEMLVNHASITREVLGSEWSRYRRSLATFPNHLHSDDESSDYPPDVSPIILAARCNQFEILQLLLARGARIERPHHLGCGCRRCAVERQRDSLRYSLLRIHTYEALASPAWISLTSPDPVLTAFNLSWELQKLAVRENEFCDQYATLSDQCGRYACDLLEQCRTSDEVTELLNHSGSDENGTSNGNSKGEAKIFDDDTADDVSDENEAERRERYSLSRLRLALKYEQKQFVAHPHTQQLLSTLWYEGLPGWRKRTFLVKLLLVMGLIAGMPIMALSYLLFPRSAVGQLVRKPFIKFMYHSATFVVFLCLLILASTNVTVGDAEYKLRKQQRGPAPTPLEWLVLLYVTGFVWSECKQLWEEGLKAYVRQWWNWLDFIMLSLYLCTFSLRLVAFAHSFFPERYGPSTLPRTLWPNGDPTIVSEGVFAVANVFSFFRIIYLFQANPTLGPLQISLGCMLIDIGKFLLIFFLVLISFACGLNQLYYYYTGPEVLSHASPTGTAAPMTGDTSTWMARARVRPPVTQSTIIGRPGAASSPLLHHGDYEDGFANPFDPLSNSMTTLFWALFGLTQLNAVRDGPMQEFTKRVGEHLLMVYHAMAIIVLINMLIAMMSNSFQNIENHADREWKFARSKLWIGYFDEGSSLPPPFNLIISPKSAAYFFRAMWDLCRRCFCPSSSQPASPAHHSDGIASSDVPEYNQNILLQQGAYGISIGKQPRHLTRYQLIMRRLVRRYIHQIKKQQREDGVNEDDLLEIKQDISSLRYELRDDRRLFGGGAGGGGTVGGVAMAVDPSSFPPPLSSLHRREVGHHHTLQHQLLHNGGVGDVTDDSGDVRAASNRPVTMADSVHYAVPSRYDLMRLRKQASMFSSPRGKMTPSQSLGSPPEPVLEDRDESDCVGGGGRGGRGEGAVMEQGDALESLRAQIVSGLRADLRHLCDELHVTATSTFTRSQGYHQGHQSSHHEVDRDDDQTPL